jgi:hypothetical protein
MSVRSYIVDDREKKTFLLDREVLVSEDVLRTEMARIATSSSAGAIPSASRSAACSSMPASSAPSAR